MNRPLVAGNWKMHKTPQEGISFVGGIVNLLLDMEKTDIIFCPPFPALFGVKELLKGTSCFLGAQNCHWEKKGAFTGEVSAEMLNACGVDYVILGHSERRHVFGEPDGWINQKVHAVLKEGLKPILCIGETIQEREDGNTTSVLTRQLTKGLFGLESLENVVVAYEPVWAIGTGVNATPDMVAEAHQMVRDCVGNLFTEKQAKFTPILYGGSVKPDNASELIRTEGVNGFLIGGASLEMDSFLSIIQNVENS